MPINKFYFPKEVKLAAEKPIGVSDARGLSPELSKVPLFFIGKKSAFPLCLRRVGFSPIETIRLRFYLRKVTQELVRKAGGFSESYTPENFAHRSFFLNKKPNGQERT